MNNFEYTLTNDQINAVNAFKNFLSDDTRFFILNGSAGTGKSFLLSYIINNVLKHCNKALSKKKIKRKPYYITATTHKACDVLSGLLPKENIQTIHSLLGVTVYTDYDSGKQSLKMKKVKSIFDSIIFIDECSMIDDELLDIITKYTKTCKIIFIGDKCQLPPVNQIISSTYTLNSNTVVCNLTEVKRNTDNILALAQSIRNIVESGSFSELKYNNIDICVYDILDFKDALINEFLNVGNNRARILCYTNAVCQKYNSCISKIRKTDEKIQTNEYYVCANSLKFKGRTLPSDAEVYISKIHDNDMCTVSTKYPFEVYRCELNWNDLTGDVKIVKDYTNYNNALKDLASKKDWKSFYYLKEYIADLRPIEVSTVHKAQGSTLDRVYIDLNDLCSCHDPFLFARLLYVAVTRAKEKVIFFGSLNPKYGTLSLKESN